MFEHLVSILNLMFENCIVSYVSIKVFILYDYECMFISNSYFRN